MIFLSHNSKDKVIVEPFANKLAEVFGRDSIFYDSWSIQPGDGIIDKMESGLSDAKYFFLLCIRKQFAKWHGKIRMAKCYNESNKWKGKIYSNKT